MKRVAPIGLFVLWTLSPAANAYVRSRTPRGVPVSWPGNCIFVQPDSAGTPDLPADQVFATIQKSLQNWQSVSSSCSYLQLIYDAPMPLEAHLDGVNIVKFRTDRWCHPNDDQQNNVCYSSHAVGITTVFYVDHGQSDDGTILDADVELNDLNFTFVTLPMTQTPRPDTDIADLENTLTHELGHLQGLDHTCADASTPANEVDEQGNRPPPCGSLLTLPVADQLKIEEATMFNVATPGETKKRSVEQDDANGICAAYPTDHAPGICAHTDPDRIKPHGCSAGGPGSPQSQASMALLALLVAALALLGLRRRRTN